MDYIINMPKVTIISGCYNNAKFLEKAIFSVFKQTFRDFELLIIDDASTDSSIDKLYELSKHNSRLKLLRNSHNKGLAKTLNLAIDQSDSKYIARFDTDDLMHPQRLEKQLNFLKDNNIDLLGTYIKTIGKGRSKIVEYPKSDKAIRLQLLFQSPFAHPSVIYNRAALGSLRYDSHAGKAEDYALWIDFAQKARMANIPEPLLYYRLHTNQISANKTQQNQDAAILRLKALNYYYNLDVSVEEQQIHRKLRFNEPYEFHDDLLSSESWLLKLDKYFNNDEAHQQIVHEWFLCCIKATHFGKWAWNKYKSSSLLSKTKVNLNLENQLYFLCLSKIRYQSKIYKLLTHF